MTAGFSLRGLLVALGIVALGLPAAFAGLFSAIAQIGRINTGIAVVREGQLNAADVLRLQIEQETSVRGYAATRDPEFAATYRSAASEFPLRVADLAGRLQLVAENERALDALAAARRISQRWQQTVAQPSLARRQPAIDDRTAKAELDRFRDDLDVVNAVLLADYHVLIRTRGNATGRASLIGYTAVVVVGLQLLVYAFLAERLRGELVRERSVATLLQRAFTAQIGTDPQLEIGTAYVSATRGAKVGGDLYDIFALDADRTLIVIADVSGKGVGAALDSTFVRYSLRAFASEHGDIGTIVTKFNSLYCHSQKPPEAFVVIFAAILDHRSARLDYVGAGHEAAYVVRADRVDRLEPTGPIVGLGIDVRFDVGSALLGHGDVLFLSTDGLTEARNPGGTFLGGTGLETWLAQARGLEPAALVDRMTQRLRFYTRARSNDDLAIVAVRRRAERGDAAGA